METKHSITVKLMNTFRYIVLLILILFIKIDATSQVFPPEKKLIFEAVPEMPRPEYLKPVSDPTFGSVIIRITDKAVFDSIKPGLRPFHHYPKNQPWNSDGSLILLDGWPGAVLDGNIYKFVRYVDPPTEPHGWSNTKPNIVYGTNKPNLLVKLDVSTNITQTIREFSEYSYISYGDQEGSPSNDDRYISLICKKPSNEIDIVVYDLLKNKVVSKMDIPEWPNNCTISQSGKYVLVQYMTDSTGPKQGLCAYNLKDLSFIRNIMALSIHYDVGYDTEGNEVVVCSDRDHNSRAVIMTRIDNGKKTTLLSPEKMSWPMHISCRNIKRSGYAYLSEFAESYSEPDKPNAQKIFALKLDPAANGDALTEIFSHEWHSDVVEEDRCPFGVPNRDGSKVMFRSDWMNGKGEINSYVTFMPTVK